VAKLELTNERRQLLADEALKGQSQRKQVHMKDGSGGSLPTLFSLGYSDGYSLEPATLEVGQRAAVRALTTLGAGCCIACQRS
jgi:hypothetical protein